MHSHQLFVRLLNLFLFCEFYGHLQKLQGISLVCELIDGYGLDVVQAYMKHIQNNAEIAVRNLLKQVCLFKIEKQ